jgi:hypothetical protein
MPFGPISVDTIRQLTKAHFPHSNDLWKFGDPFLMQLALIVLMSNSEVVPQKFNHRQISQGRSIVMVAATVDKDQTFPSRKDRVRSSGERQGRSPAGPILFCALRSPVRGRMRGGMRIFIHNDQISPDRLVRQALYLLFKAGVYSAESCGSIRAPGAVQIDAAHLPEAIAALSKAGIRAAID